MLRFTQDQNAAVVNMRRAFNANQADMQRRFGDTLVGSSAIGNATTLPRDVWGDWDTEAVEIQRDVLAVFDAFSGFSKPFPIGKIVQYFQRMSDSGEVNVTIDGRAKAKSDQQVFDYVGTPVPVLDSTFSYGWRQMAAAQAEGVALDAGGRRNAMRKVAEKQELMMLDGDNSVVVGGNALYGFRNHPQRETRSTGITLNGETGANWKTEIIAVLNLLQANNFYTNVTVMLNWSDWFYASSTDYSTQYAGKSILQKIMEIPSVSRVVPASRIAVNEIIAVVESRDVVEVISAMPMVTQPLFRQNPHDEYDFVTMAVVAPQIKYDYDNQCGVAHSS